jgi:hypothetical protein
MRFTDYDRHDQLYFIHATKLNYCKYFELYAHDNGSA